MLIGGWGYYMRLHRNSLKLMGTIPLMTYCISVVFGHFRYQAAAFDDIEEQLPSVAAERERSDILRLCLLSDYSMNTRALLGEVRYSKAPSDYIYASLVN